MRDVAVASPTTNCWALANEHQANKEMKVKRFDKKMFTSFCVLARQMHANKEVGFSVWVTSSLCSCFSGGPSWITARNARSYVRHASTRHEKLPAKKHSGHLLRVRQADQFRAFQRENQATCAGNVCDLVVVTNNIIFCSIYFCEIQKSVSLLSNMFLRILPSFSIDKEH